MPRIAVLCHDLSSNALGRAYVLAQACPPSWKVSLWGPRSSSQVWAPLAHDTRFEIHSLPHRRWPPRPREMQRWIDPIAEAADLVYASKPVATSYGVARQVRERTGRPLVLDVDDWELGFRIAGGVHWKIVVDGILHVRNPLSYFPTKRLETPARREPFVTASTRFLQERFGGVILPHARDESWLVPDRWDGEASRRAHGLAGKKVVLFFGTPRPHKGVEDLVEAVAGITDPAVRCVIVGGEPNDPFVQALSRRPRVTVLPPVPFERIPEIVSMAHVVAVPQRAGIGTRGQFPAKIVDALAMAKPIVATRVEEIPEALRDGAGLIVEPGDPKALQGAIQRLLDDPEEAHAMGRRARARFEEEFGLVAARRRLLPVLEEALASTRPPDEASPDGA